MAENLFAPRLIVGTAVTDPTVQSGAGDPNGVVTGNAGDFYLRTNGSIYSCLGAAVWVINAAGAGDVTGPAASTDNAIARWDLLTGKLLQDSVVIVTDLGVMTGGTWQGVSIKEGYGGTGNTVYVIGDILVASAPTTLTKLAIGTNDYVLTADSTQPTGVRWGSPTWKTVGNVTSNSLGTIATDDLVFGSTSLDYAPANQAHRLWFDKSNGAFRAGQAIATYWDAANVGAYSVAFGSNCKASGANAAAFGTYAVASGARSVAGGHNPTASGNYSVAFGYKTVASGIYGFVLGLYSTASGPSAASIGERTVASTNSAFAHGYRTTASHIAERAFGYSKMPAGTTVNTCFGVEVTWMGQTTNNAATEIFLNGSTATLRMTVAANVTYAFSILLGARRTGATTESAGYEFKGVIKNDAGTTAIVGVITKLVIGEDSAAWDAAITADNANDAIVVTVTGENAKTINWVASGYMVRISGV